MDKEQIVQEIQENNKTINVLNERNIELNQRLVELKTGLACGDVLENKVSNETGIFHVSDSFLYMPQVRLFKKDGNLGNRYRGIYDDVTLDGWTKK